MLDTVAIRGYRSLREIVLPLRRLTVITGANGTGKSSLYRALRLLADCGRGEVIASFAREGGVESAMWAGPEHLGGARRTGTAQGGPRTRPVSIELGYAADDFGYLIDLGLPQARETAFGRDPEVKRELVFAGPVARPTATLVRRVRGLVEVAADTGRGFDALASNLPAHRSVLADWAGAVPELVMVRERLRDWRFYDGFRADSHAPARMPQVGTRTPVLADDGADLAAAVQTILETGTDDFGRAVADAFDGATVSVSVTDGLFDLHLRQRGMLRTLRSAEMSDGTLRFLLWAAALLSPRPPSLMVLNEPETSLHPDLVRPLAELIDAAATRTQVVVVTHSATLRTNLGAQPIGSDGDAWEIELYKDWGETKIAEQGLLTTPPWDWGKR
ncbi:AAA family ATPase [Mycolicibacterium austroafricanum]|uniref:AAA family ATPase n=1 Tax=Mycolicibacterium austroafricanum TaxID=39687 RepID=A0ABT8HBG0_MYCAO|nr:AAA family ATPase [Mycolicibacterium austroafricanum]MDN4518111.1 AAA family ATPase [Mycolicibacterium austroafricanum]PQP45879.1 ATP-binding protein [Mycolicibacterium austroafricanum]QRZ08653.1 AAA family ATPase [Mycolicibacterium austroafricanum]QZT70303.1 AAA family ATPase [Mycolicibacterium austroafricanum]